MVPGQDLPSESDFNPETDDFFHVFEIGKRSYKHFDLPLPVGTRVQLDFSSVSKPHRFYPLLGFSDVKRRVHYDAHGALKVVPKVRQIRFASHSDAAYLAAYSSAVSVFYEAAISIDDTSASVLAYRKGGQTNIHHAKHLFDEVRLRQSCVVLAVDIKGFFDNLDHRHLKYELSRLLCRGEKVTGHHWTVYRNITRYSWVETVDLDKYIGKKRVRNGRVCSVEDFNTFVQGRSTGLVQTHTESAGIPQGTPVSGLYANVYMRSFDADVKAWAKELDGSYRRYSDDIAVVLPITADITHTLECLKRFIEAYGLFLSEDKTDITNFENGNACDGKSLQYLGFTYDGKYTLIRQSSLAAYQKKMNKGVRAKLIAAKARNIHPANIYKRELYSRYTHLGKRRTFFQYAMRAASILEAPEIRSQLRRHFQWFEASWSRNKIRFFSK